MNDNILCTMSSVVDGSVSKSVTDEQRFANRKNILANQGIAPEQAILVHLKYEGDDYRRYYTVSTEQAGNGIVQPSSIVADGLFTRERNVALMLPVADCIGATIYDPTNRVLGLGHLGRHNLLQSGGEGLVNYMVNEFGSISGELIVWLSAAAGRQNYPLHDFENRSLHEVATQQLLDAGVNASHITIDRRDTTTDESLFSHSEFLKGNRLIDGRQAVVAMMKL